MLSEVGLASVAFDSASLVKALSRYVWLNYHQLGLVSFSYSSTT